MTVHRIHSPIKYTIRPKVIDTLINHTRVQCMMYTLGQILTYGNRLLRLAGELLSIQAVATPSL